MPNTKIERLPSFTPRARELWSKVPAPVRPQLLSNVYCGTCRGSTTIVDYKGAVKHGMLVLTGCCKRCGLEVARVIE